MSRPAAGDRTLVIRNGTMIDGSGRAPTPNDALVVEGNRIRSVGRLPESVRLDGSRTDVDVIDASGQWVMPELIDAHTHLSYGTLSSAAKVEAGGPPGPSSACSKRRGAPRRCCPRP